MIMFLGPIEKLTIFSTSIDLENDGNTVLDLQIIEIFPGSMPSRPSLSPLV